MLFYYKGIEIKSDEIKQIITTKYSKIVKSGCGCGNTSSCCVGGAILKDKYLKIIKNAGFKVRLLAEDKDISKRQYNGIKVESIMIEATKESNQ